MNLTVNNYKNVLTRHLVAARKTANLIVERLFLFKCEKQGRGIVNYVKQSNPVYKPSRDNRSFPGSDPEKGLGGGRLL